ncbi:hypothetical protein N0V82_003833 [Gnomoniopsis sp. IMI 355080]|nr:hypothetical protein N0V82_003833 [Gnomoniopsis sp. IMI 355080]
MDNLDVLIKRRDEQHAAYLQTNHRVEELLLAAASPPSSPVRDAPRSPGASASSPQTTSNSRPPWRQQSIGLDSVITSSASRATGEGSDDEEDGEEYYVQTPLEKQQYDHDGLRAHLRSFKFSSASRVLLRGVLDDPAFLSKPTLFPTQKGPVADRSHLSHHQVFEVGTDGAPLPVELRESERPPYNALVIWNTIKDVNATNVEDSTKRNAVGRISIIQEPSPILFGAIHYTMHRYFDVDELYRHLLSPEGSSASLDRAFHADERHQRSFVFNLEYMTLIGEDCQPLPWQLSDSQKERRSDHIAITRCSSVVALWLGGPPIKKLKSRSRRAKGLHAAHTHGYAYDPFGPWQVLNVQCYPDWKSSLDVHDSTRHYVNGVEAFMVSLLGELVDAEGRFEAIYHKITKLVTPPLDFMFNADVRERLLFEDAGFTYVRRYFWATQTLGIIKNSIKTMIDAYEDNFTDEVWAGNHKSLWPLLEEQRQRNIYFRKKMSTLRNRFNQQILKLKSLIGEIDDRRAEIQNLREELFIGTSIQESRKSVENSDITVQQGHNIKLLTMVSIFFLPLTFVTSLIQSRKKSSALGLSVMAQEILKGLGKRLEDESRFYREQGADMLSNGNPRNSPHDAKMPAPLPRPTVLTLLALVSLLFLRTRFLPTHPAQNSQFPLIIAESLGTYGETDNHHHNPSLSPSTRSSSADTYFDQTFSLTPTGDDDFRALRKQCSHTKWLKENGNGTVYLQCEGIYLGLTSVISQVKSCFKMAIEAGAGVILPNIPLRAKNNLLAYNQGNHDAERPFGAWFDETHLVESMQGACPGLDMISPQDIEQGRVEVQNEWSIDIHSARFFRERDGYFWAGKPFDAFFEENLRRLREEHKNDQSRQDDGADDREGVHNQLTRSTHSGTEAVDVIGIRADFELFSVINDPTGHDRIFWHDLGRMLRFRPEPRMIVDQMLQQIGEDKSFFAVHFRGEGDNMWAAPEEQIRVDLDALDQAWETYKHDEGVKYAGGAKPLVYLACGDEESIQAFVAAGKERGWNVTSKPAREELLFHWHYGQRL